MSSQLLIKIHCDDFYRRIPPDPHEMTMKITVSKNAEKDLREFFKEEILKAKQETYMEIYKFMQHKSRLKIHTVQDNWIATMRMLETYLHPIINNNTKNNNF